MKQLKLFFAGLATTMMSGGAGQAQQPPAPRGPAPSAMPMPAFSWTGCHAGLHGGWGRVDTTANVRSAGFVASSDFNSDGVLYGGQFGCDYQALNGWVVGLQGDIAGSTIDGQTSIPAYDTTVSADTKWLASITGRVGYTVLPQTLLYLRAGGAWTRQSFNISGFVISPGVDGNYSKTFSGWTVGGGFAWALSDRWSAFVEYNHYDFGGAFTSNASGLGQTINVGGPTIDAVKLGVDFRF